MEAPQLIADANRLASSIGVLPKAEAQPSLIVVCGLPGTGKSHFCHKLAERLPFLILESDALRKHLLPSPTYSIEESSHLFRAIHQLIEYLLKKGISIILDATNLEERHRERLYNIAERLGARLILISVQAPPELVEKRLKKRMSGKNVRDNSDADWEVYQKMKATAEKIKRRHFTVDTSKDITIIINKVVREAKR